MDALMTHICLWPCRGPSQEPNAQGCPQSSPSSGREGHSSIKERQGLHLASKSGRGLKSGLFPCSLAGMRWDIRGVGDPNPLACPASAGTCGTHRVSPRRPQPSPARQELPAPHADTSSARILIPSGELYAGCPRPGTHGPAWGA